MYNQYYNFKNITKSTPFWLRCKESHIVKEHHLQLETHYLKAHDTFNERHCPVTDTAAI